MGRLCVAFLVIALAGGCSGKSEPTTPANGAKEPAAQEEVSGDGKNWGGWRYKGKRDDCFYRVGRDCFDSLAKACKAAGCSKDACTHDQSAPARVSCKK